MEATEPQTAISSEPAPETQTAPDPIMCLETCESPVASCVLKWANGRLIHVLPISYIMPVKWEEINDPVNKIKERVSFECGGLKVEIHGCGIANIPEFITRGQLSCIRVLGEEQAALQEGPVVTGIEVTLAEPKDSGD